MNRVQTRMLRVLSDGLPHEAEELVACLADELGDGTNIHPHLTALRKEINPRGEDIIHERGPLYGFKYRLVRMVASPYNGKR